MTSVPGDKQIEILLVDDDPAAVRLAQETIKTSNHQTNVSVAEDGDMAMAILRKEGKYADTPHPDLILPNLRLPKMDGPEC